MFSSAEPALLNQHTTAQFTRSIDLIKYLAEAVDM